MGRAEFDKHPRSHHGGEPHRQWDVLNPAGRSEPLGDHQANAMRGWTEWT